MYSQCVANSCWAEPYIIHILNPQPCGRLVSPDENTRRKYFLFSFFFPSQVLIVSSLSTRRLKVISAGTTFKGEDPDFKQNNSRIGHLAVCTGGLKDD